jgi:Trk-type K+ transport systems, membrane components
MIKSKYYTPARIIVLGFVFVILIGAFLLWLPFSSYNNIHVTPMEALFTSAASVCITGLGVFDIANTFNGIGKTVIAILIQIGGLGVSSIGIGFILITRKKINSKERILLREGLNLTTMKGLAKFIQSIFLLTLIVEIIGTLFHFITFSKHFPFLTALGMSAFHSISAFNNAGIDVWGDMHNQISYHNNALFYITTCILVILGGLGFVAITEVLHKHSLKKFSLHTKIVLAMTSFLLIIGTILFKISEPISWLDAFFYSVSSRTAGFQMISFQNFSTAGLFIMCMLMFIGASPGSTGGGIKTTTFFVLIKNALSVARNKPLHAFKRKISNDLVAKAFMIFFLAFFVICVDTFIIALLNPHFPFIEILVETIGALSTTGFSTGMTPYLDNTSRLLLIITMFIGRLGPLTIATVWHSKPKSNVNYSEENITIG